MKQFKLNLGLGLIATCLVLAGMIPATLANANRELVDNVGWVPPYVPKKQVLIDKNLGNPITTCMP